MDPGILTALQLHARADSLALDGQTGAEALARAMTHALTGLHLLARATLAARLRAVIHECIADAAGDPAALQCWAGILCGGQPFPAQADFTSGISAVGPLCGGGVWGRILSFCVSLEALAGGLHAVNRCFRQLVSQPASWAGHDITLHERHLQGVTVRGDIGWGRAFTLLPALRDARTIRVPSFADTRLRSQILTPLQNVCRTLCREATLLSCSFCEHHAGENVDLPSPRRLTAARRPSCTKGGGILIGSGPLEEAADRRRLFKIHIEDLPPGERLDIGVTSLSPHEQFVDRVSSSRSHRHMAFAEDLLGSWIIESSGLLVGSHTGLRIRDSRWDARRLSPGDDIVLAVTARGELTLSVNDEIRASWRAQISIDTPIYPVIDLFEGSPLLRMVPNAIS